MIIIYFLPNYFLFVIAKKKNVNFFDANLINLFFFTDSSNNNNNSCSIHSSAGNGKAQEEKYSLKHSLVENTNLERSLITGQTIYLLKKKNMIQPVVLRMLALLKKPSQWLWKKKKQKKNVQTKLKRIHNFFCVIFGSWIVVPVGFSTYSVVRATEMSK